MSALFFRAVPQYSSVVYMCAVLNKSGPRAQEGTRTTGHDKVIIHEHFKATDIVGDTNTDLPCAAQQFSTYGTRYGGSITASTHSDTPSILTLFIGLLSL
jgi:hypothetical protein